MPGALTTPLLSGPAVVGYNQHHEVRDRRAAQRRKC